MDGLMVAKYIVTKCTRDRAPISNLQLQKIMFLIQKETCYKGQFLIEDDFVAWKYGPVIESVYYEFCAFGSRPIMREYDSEIEEFYVRGIDKKIERLRESSPWILVEETHKKGGPWEATVNQLGIGSIISKALIAGEKLHGR